VPRDRRPRRRLVPGDVQAVRADQACVGASARQVSAASGVMSRTSLEHPVSKLVNSDTCPRPTTAGGGGRASLDAVHPLARLAAAVGGLDRGDGAAEGEDGAGVHVCPPPCVSVESQLS
jgi:hypothetical protein